MSEITETAIKISDAVNAIVVIFTFLKESTISAVLTGVFMPSYIYIQKSDP
jgi:hypothetical protein